jgi:hypothetical protein
MWRLPTLRQRCFAECRATSILNTLWQVQDIRPGVGHSWIIINQNAFTEGQPLCKPRRVNIRLESSNALSYSGAVMRILLLHKQTAHPDRRSRQGTLHIVRCFHHIERKLIIKLSPAWSPVFSSCNAVDEIGFLDRVMPFGNEVHITGVGDGQASRPPL